MSVQALARIEDLGNGIRCVDVEHERMGLACCYLVESGSQVALVETGTAPGVPRLLATLKALGIAATRVRYVIVTHVHLDHAGAAGALIEALPNATLVVHPRGARHLVDPSQLIAGAQAVYGQEAFERSYGTLVPVAPSRLQVAEDGHELDFNGRTLRFMDSPGHARHHFCVWDALSQGWFTGDTFGLSYREFDLDTRAWIMPTSTPVQWEPEAWFATLDRLLEPRPQWMYLTHFGAVGEVQRLGEELRQGIADYRDIALGLADSPDRHSALTKALLEHALTRLRRFGSPMDDARVKSLLAMDLDLNAQGLAVWLDRRAR